MKRDVGIGRARVEVLARHENGFAVSVDARTDELHVGRKREVAIDSLVGEVEGVFRGPDVRSAASDAILARGCIEFNRTGSRSIADIAVRFIEGVLAGWAATGELGSAARLRRRDGRHGVASIRGQTAPAPNFGMDARV